MSRKHHDNLRLLVHAAPQLDTNAFLWFHVLPELRNQNRDQDLAPQSAIADQPGQSVTYYRPAGSKGPDFP
jgi:hypothetical protein